MDVNEISLILRDDVVILVGGPHAYFRVGSDHLVSAGQGLAGEELPWIQYVDPQIGPEANGRKWRISTHATKSEVVQTAFMAVLAWQEHELREGFLYKGQAIFGPHFNVDGLARILAQNGGKGALDVRKPAP